MAEKTPRIENWRSFVFRRFFPCLWADIKRGKLGAQLIGILLALLVLLAQFHFGVIGSDGIHGRVLSIISPYVALMGAFVIYHAVRTPWLISNDHLDSIKATESAKTALQQELESLKQVPPTIEVRMIELYRKPVNSGRDGNPKDGFLWDIFLSVWIELKSPLTASITGYRMQLSLHGNRMSLQAQNDLDEWGLGENWHMRS
jgi:hypothetical protein